MKRDHLAGLLLIVLGLGAATEGYRHALGTLQQLGPGALPFLLGLLLAGLGVAIAGTAGQAPLRKELPIAGEPEGAGAEWRGWIAITGSVAAFIGLAAYGGMVPATFACVLLAALGDRGGSVKEALALATGVTLVGVLVFSYGLRVQLPLFRWGVG